MKNQYFSNPIMLKVREYLTKNGDYQDCAAIGFKDRLIFCDNGHVADVNADYIEILDKLSWIDISDAVLGDY